MIINEQKIIDYAFGKLPDPKDANNRLYVVWVNDFIGHEVPEVCKIELDENDDDIEIMIKESYLQSDSLSHVYYVIFQIEHTKAGKKWDLVGYDKQEIQRQKLHGYH